MKHAGNSDMSLTCKSVVKKIGGHLKEWQANTTVMNTEVEVKKAQEYIAKHGIKHIFAQLLTDSTLYRPKDPVAFFIERLKNYKEHGLGSDYEFPRIILMLCPNEGLQTVGEAIAMDYDFKLINPKLVEEMIFEIKEHRREHDSDTFLLINCPNKVKDIMEFEKQLHEFVLCISVTCPSDNQNNYNVEQYFLAQGKLFSIEIKENEADKLYHKLAALF